MKQRRNGFTMVELLAALGIIAVLAAILFYAFHGVDKTIKGRGTEVQMESLKGMTTEFEVNGGNLVRLDNDFYGGSNVPLIAPKKVLGNEAGKDAVTAMRDEPLTIATRRVLARFNANPLVSKMYGALPAESFLDLKKLEVNPLVPYPLIDSWGRPIIYVPAGGLSGVTAGGQVWIVTSVGKFTAAGSIPAGARGFWASAGLDGDFSKGDDNIYSFGK